MVLVYAHLPYGGGLVCHYSALEQGLGASYKPDGDFILSRHYIDYKEPAYWDPFYNGGFHQKRVYLWNSLYVLLSASRYEGSQHFRK